MSQQMDPGTGSTSPYASAIATNNSVLQGAQTELKTFKDNHDAFVAEHNASPAGTIAHDGEKAYQTALSQLELRVQQSAKELAAVQNQEADWQTKNNPKPQTPDQARTTTANADAAAAKAADDARLAAERGNPAHPGLTNLEATTKDQTQQGISSLDASRQLAAQTALIDAQYRQDTLAGKSVDQALAAAKFQYDKVKNALDMQVAANDKAVAERLAQQKHDETIRGQDISQRDTDTTTFGNMTDAALKDFIPAGSMGDYNEIVKGITTPGYQPQLTGSIASHPFNASAVAQGWMQNSPPHIAALGQGIAAQVAQGMQNPPTMTAPGAAIGPSTYTPPTIVTNSNAGGSMLMTDRPAYDPNTGFVPGGGPPPTPAAY